MGWSESSSCDCSDEATGRGGRKLSAGLGFVLGFSLGTQNSVVNTRYFLALRPSATRKIALFPLACGEKKFTTSSS